MAWEEELFGLFDDLEAQAAGAHALERAAELADRGRAEYARVTLASRLMATVGAEVVLAVRGVGPVSGVLERVAAGWCLVRGAGQDWVVVLHRVGSVAGASVRGVPEAAWSPVARLGLASALRRLADTETPCVLHLEDQRLEGVVRRVGADFAEVAVGGEGRLVLVAFHGLCAVQSR